MEKERLEKALENRGMFKNCLESLDRTDKTIEFHETKKKDDEYTDIMIYGSSFKVERSIVRKILINDKERLESRIKELNKEFEEI